MVNQAGHGLGRPWNNRNHVTGHTGQYKLSDGQAVQTVTIQASRSSELQQQADILVTTTITTSRHFGVSVCQIVAGLHK